MKKVVSVLMAVCLFLVFVSCGSAAPAVTSSSAVESANPDNSTEAPKTNEEEKRESITKDVFLKNFFDITPQPYEVTCLYQSSAADERGICRYRLTSTGADSGKIPFQSFSIQVDYDNVSKNVFFASIDIPKTELKYTDGTPFYTSNSYLYVAAENVLKVLGLEADDATKQKVIYSACVQKGDDVWGTIGDWMINKYCTGDFDVFTAMSATQPDDSVTTAPDDDVEQQKTTTMGETNAMKSAKNYLAIMPFSHSGLMEQLKYDGYSSEEALYAADKCGADWSEQARKSAKAYLGIMAFSRQGLIDQLKYDGYTAEQAAYGAKENGY